MKKITLFVAFVLYFVFAQQVSAQNASREQFAKVYNDYRQKYDEYLSLHDKYVLSKKQYDQYGTLTSKENLQKDLQQMLVARDNVLIYYYRSLISKMDDSLVTMSDQNKSDYTSRLNDEINWLTDHRNQYYEDDVLTELSAKSKEVEDRVNAFQKGLYENLYYIARGKFDTYELRYGGLYNDLNVLTEKIKNENREAYKLSNQKISTIDRWFSEIGLKAEELNKLLGQGDMQIAKAQGKYSLNVYNGSVSILNKVMAVFIDRIIKTKEIINEIKVSEN
ncbi:MAG: hypothetical protein UT39_C0018G0022 [Candidatus Woesebacteria bacterium GW2011_GWA1_39_21]|uniref:Uncharacterized protein n=1 Tax=Candidatus Woesebacteria bacterium GW2011_GWA1_39_21 TaxID=1618550 RepID=A0A0G0N2S3_9BACT|nr:MAG: hypothetical protein UT39_C0018G0022 [Candidatus Woesebacteria bacterium GW2011_GWA1_39_21]